MSDRPCLSIVIPVYNVEEYLDRCLSSVISASGIQMTEIILVDDGSTDKSGRIADSYADQYEYIESFHKTNGGLSDARNYGLGKAKGKYVVFIDSDDMVVPDGLDRVINEVSDCDADVLLWNGKAINEDDIVVDSVVNLILVHNGLPTDGMMLTGTETMVKQIEDHKKIAMTAWLRAVRREYIINNNLFFEKGLIHEDELWTPKVMLCANTVKYLDENVYLYRIRNNSIMSNDSDKKEHAEAFIHILNELYPYYEEHTADDKDRNLLLANWADTYLWMITAYDAGRSDCADLIPRRRIFKSSDSFKSGIKGLILLIFGVKFYCGLRSLLK